MRISVDEHKCQGATLCLSAASELLEMTPDRSHAVVTVAEVPEDLRDAAEEAADICPFAAIDLAD